MLVQYFLLLETIVLRAVSGHLIVSSPEPYSNKTLNNSPLAADGSDFPCKLRTDAFLAPSTETIYKIGVKNTMRFIGSSTHGGGSCQLSLTEDLAPSKESKWKVIKSYEGGCPANVGGNLAGGPDADNNLQLDFVIPENIHSGRYTLAWTWFNRIGNREMYMNCAPITVTSGSSPQSYKSMQDQTASFPPMFIANINGCITKEGVDIRFPRPGSIIEHNGQPNNLLQEVEPPCTGTPTFTALAAIESNILDAARSDLGETISSSTSSALPRIQSPACSCRALRRNSDYR
ncbi:CAZyme family AA11 [Penicillium atrosanguineum]|uniref:CAZyme family AA11 n=1 Tax=Penicillium atrosanguineum TaxID=1132637 RepID=A0A9W9QBQ1_9EURO|nr:CAZyme family AA11 [Penicillium atrosanguineum]